MIPPEEIIKIFLLIPAIILLFYSIVYLILYELKVQPELCKFYRNFSIILAIFGAIFISLYMVI
ncbi:hypothetical protein STK_13115 [Sulfurisphaera tokodaii str. 7]|uniref:Uncharacterized protein n=1 Tax=Sulfurisphaera tokodaii (strain DSM 16993 / JCM 10545 / NBRC 100140 / 7) TaxID=273063 RepID=F9VP16_SULTO|nr:hypothetical protein [Sulfurisphaera tokodaii]BAK54524.1 hypothetical protein STK_13115 [Sulfurisphaera tokodaii str. 7]